MLEFFAVDFIKAVISLIIVVDPLGNIPIFLGITGNLTPKQRRRVFNIAILTGFILLLLFASVGNWVLKIFNIELYSFRIAGGALLLFIALELLIKNRFEARIYNHIPEGAGAVPLGVPLLVGPGAITTVIIILESSGFMVALASVAVVAILTWLTLRFINTIHEILGEIGSIVVSKIMAMLLAAIAVQYILEGIGFWWSRHITRQ
ncbi:MAG: MarC family protein [Aigarchaeota archaeon]|nr:MarC family protein [Aigarchaeota archaeon]